MTDYVLSLVPVYGLALVFSCVAIACLAVPLPSSMLVLASGGFAAAGDFELWKVMAVASAAFIIGDQIAFHLARSVGPSLLQWIRQFTRLKPMVTKAEALLEDRGQLAVFISHTILSPAAPYVTYLSGVGGLGWGAYTIAAIPGAILWTLFYVLLGYGFASKLSVLSDILSSFIGIIAAVAAIVLSAFWIRHRWAAAAAKRD